MSEASRRAKARERFQKLCEHGEDLGLYAEQALPDGTMLGNFPQAYTHLALIEAAMNLHDAADSGALREWARKRSGRGRQEKDVNDG